MTCKFPNFTAYVIATSEIRARDEVSFFFSNVLGSGCLLGCPAWLGW